MLKRSVEIKVRLTQEEADALTARVQKSGYSRERYIRLLLNGYIPRERPPPAYHDMMRELHRIGNNLNQIAHRAHGLHVVDAERYDDAMRQFAEIVHRIEQAVILPQKAGR